MDLPKLPNLPDPEKALSIIDKAGNAIEKGFHVVDAVADKFDQVALKLGPPPATPATAPLVENKPSSPGQKTTPTTTLEPETIATACVSCSLGHFSTSAGLLNEAVRFKEEGIGSNEILDRIAKILEEQNALERVDLTPEKLQRTPPWEREIAEEALRQSRKLRHRLESIASIDELEQAAADTAKYYREMNRQWNKGRLAHLGKKRGSASKLDDGEEVSETISSFIEKRRKERGVSDANTEKRSSNG